MRTCEGRRTTRTEARTHEQLGERILDRLADAVVAADRAQAIVYANAAAERLLGYAPGELLGRPLTTLVPERLRPQHLAGFARYLATGVAHVIGRTLQVPALHRDGTEIPIELSLTAYERDDGLLILGVLRDLRERVELERQLRVRRYMQTATAAAVRLTEKLDEGHVARTAVEALVGGFDAALARLWRLDEDGRTLRLTASAGLSTALDGPRSVIDVATYPFKVGEVARCGEPFVRNDLTGDAQFDQDWVRKEGLQGAVVLPVRAGPALRGVLACFFREAVEPEVQDVLLAFAALVGGAMNDARLYAHQLAARNELRHALEVQGFLAETGRVLGSSLDFGATLAAAARLAVPTLADWCAVEILRPDLPEGRQFEVAHVDPSRVALARELRVRYPVDPEAPHGVPEVLRSGKPEIYEAIPDDLLVRGAVDAEHLRILREVGMTSALSVPIVVRGKPVGVISLVTTAESGRRLSAADLPIVEDFARRAAIAIENAHLYREARDAIAARDDFLMVASHEIRTPLTALRLQLDAINRSHARAAENPDRQHERAAMARRQAERLTTLVAQLMDVSQLTAGGLQLNPEPVDVVQLLRTILERLTDDTARTGSRIDLDADPALVGVWDATRLDVILTNLVGNALKYGQGRPVDVVAHRDDGLARIVVRDHGIGIAPEDQHRVFERFERAVSSRHYGGFGLGLWIVRRTVQAMGGSIRLDSRPGEGSTFTVELPTNRP